MKKIIITGLLALGSAFLFASGRRRSQRATSPQASGLAAAALPREEIVRRFMLPLIVPIWIGAGVADYLWHRPYEHRDHRGTRESAVHTLMLLEGAPIVVGGALLDINAGVLALLLSFALAHEATAMFDVGFTAPRRVIFSGEQHTHSFLQVLPFAVVSLFIALYCEQGPGAVRGRQRNAPLRSSTPRASYPPRHCDASHVRRHGVRCPAAC